MGSLPVGISGSRAAAILGMSPWSTPFQVWQDIMEKRQPGFNAKHGYDYTPFEGNASTRWGLAFEDAIIKLAEDKAGKEIGSREAPFMYYMDAEKQAPVFMSEGMGFKDDYKYPHITCHVDGLYTVNDESSPIFNGPVLHEGKTTTAYGFGDKWGEPGTDKIPVEYQIQVQHQMLCTGADSAIVSVLVFPKRPDDWEEMGWVADWWEHEKDSAINGYMLTLHGEQEGSPTGNGVYDQVMPIHWAHTLDEMGFFHQYTVPANRELQSLMLDKYREWWQEYVIGETPPEPQNYDDIRALITAPTGTIIVDSDTARWFKEYKDIGSEIGATGNLAKRKEQLKVLILDHARSLESTLDDDSTDKWIFMDDRGRKVGSYGRTAKGNMVFR